MPIDNTGKLLPSHCPKSPELKSFCATIEPGPRDEGRILPTCTKR